MLITLVGMPASGKSTFGKLLAKRLDYQFVDLDKAIEAAAKCSIPALFSQFGETYFRKLETELLEKVLYQSKTVLATGGGAPCFYDNMRKINQAGFSIFIDTPLEILVSRTWADNPQARPLFAGLTQAELYTKLANLYENRSRFYEQAWSRLILN
jgi:shikimate kinase